MNSNKMKILLVEDESICQMSIASLAKKLQVDVDVAKNGLEAVQKVESNNYDLILMDMFMPEMDGKTATQEIRSKTNGKSHRIIAMSGDEMKEDELLKLGFNSFVQKPINKSKFESIINQYKA